MHRPALLAFVLGLGLAALALTAANRAAAAPAAGVVGDGTPASCTAANLSSALAGGGLVTFDCGSDPLTITVLSLQTIAQPTTIDGGHLITLYGAWATRLFEVNNGASLTLESLILSHGDSEASDGGAISNHGTLNLYNSTIRYSFTDNNHSGGAIFSDGPVNIVNSDLTKNVAGSAGALFANFGQAEVHITNSRFIDNYASNLTTGYGGAIWVGEQAQLTFSTGEISENEGRFGGGLYQSPGSVVTLLGGAGPDQLNIEGNHAGHSGGGVYNDGGQLSLLGARVLHNTVVDVTPNLGYGGGVASYGPLTITNGYFLENAGRIGGGLYISSTAATLVAKVDQSKLRRNVASLWGGGLFAEGASTLLEVYDTGFEFNNGGALGGGLGRLNANVFVHRSSFRANQADLGGGLANASFPLNNSAGVLLLRDSTVTSNMANSGQGGGLWSFGSLTMMNVTVAGNANGLFLSTGAAQPAVGNTVIHNPGALNCAGAGGAPNSLGGNFASDTTCDFTEVTDQQGNGLDPMLGAVTQALLSNHTDFHPLLAGSPLINRGLAGVACATLDQIQALRPDTCDIGAVEFNGLLPRLFLPLALR
jgi:hypothetical protein